MYHTLIIILIRMTGDARIISLWLEIKFLWQNLKATKPSNSPLSPLPTFFLFLHNKLSINSNSKIYTASKNQLRSTPENEAKKKTYIYTAFSKIKISGHKVSLKRRNQLYCWEYRNAFCQQFLLVYQSTKVIRYPLCVTDLNSKSGNRITN